MPALQAWGNMSQEEEGREAVVIFVGLVTGIVALGIYAAEADGVEILSIPKIGLSKRIALNKSIAKWNRFAVELADIGLPSELDAYAIDLIAPYSKVSEALYDESEVRNFFNWQSARESMIGELRSGRGWKDGTKLSLKEAADLADEYIRIQERLRNVVKGIDKVVYAHHNIPGWNEPSLPQAVESFNAEVDGALKVLRDFKAKYPGLTYSTANLGRYSPKEAILEWRRYFYNRMPKAIDRLFNPAKIGVAEHEAVASSMAGRGLLARAKSSLAGKFGRRSAAQAAEKSALKTAGKVGLVALVAMIGVGVAQAQELQQADAEMQQRIMENPLLAVDLSEEDAQFIEQHADNLPKTIEAYSAIAQGLYEFSNLSAQEQQEVVDLLSEDTQETSSVRHTVPTMPKAARAR